MLTRTEAEVITQRVIAMAPRSDVIVRVTDLRRCNERFAANRITAAADTDAFEVAVEITNKARTGRASVTESSDSGLRRAVTRALETSALAFPDPEYLPLLAPQHYPEIKGFDQATSQRENGGLTDVLRHTIDTAKKNGLSAAGFLGLDVECRAIANSNGLFGFSHRTWAAYSATVRALETGGSGWAGSQSFRLQEVDGTTVTEEACRLALLSQRPQRLDPGKYTVILCPSAVDEMVGFVGLSLSARATQQGETFLSNSKGGDRLGESVLGSNITLRTDPFHPALPNWPWSTEGSLLYRIYGAGGSPDLAAEKVTWIEKGTLRNLAYDRYWAQRHERKPNAFPPSNLIVDGGTASVDDLVSSTEHGILITRLWYVRLVEPQTIQVSGTTRDGTFLIERGKIAYPIVNLRFNQSVVEMLRNVEALARSEPAGAMSPLVATGLNQMPAMKVRSFNFTSVSDAV
jgi:predicted Zn-dependent protease